MTHPLDQILETSPTRLAELFAIGLDSAKWTPEELRDCLDHLLAIPFETALSQLPPELAAQLRGFAGSLQVYAAAERAQIQTFGELFQHAEPPLEALKFSKEFGKAIQNNPGPAWPTELGAVVYYTSLGVALLRHDQRIGRLSDEEMESGFRTLIALPWIDEFTRHLFEEARVKLSKE